MLDKTATKTTKPHQVPAPPKTEETAIKAPNFQVATVRVKGTAPYCQNNMSQRARERMKEDQERGSAARKIKRKRDPKDFNAAYEGAMHVSTAGWHGIPTSAFRSAMISACRTVEFAMTRAKLCIFINGDGYDRETRQPLTRLHGKPQRFDMSVRLASGVADIAARPLFEDWYADLQVRWDADMLSASDIVNLLVRAGAQVGIGAGRPDSKESSGIGFGTFEVDLSVPVSVVNVEAPKLT